MALNEEEFNAWLAHPVTKAVKELLLAKREELRQAWEGGSFTDYEATGTVLVNVGNLGTCKGYAFFTDLTYETYATEMELDNGESIGPEALGGSGAD